MEDGNLDSAEGESEWGKEGGGGWGVLHLSVVGYFTVIFPVGSRLKFSIFVGCR